jgi:fructose-1,6-bisphosphatase/inositol monophosphatase family enzyme
MNTQTAILQFLIEQARAAGAIMLRSYQKRFDIFTKADGSKVTSVDLAISKQFQAAQQQHFPEINLFTEESHSKEAIAGKSYFIVDELDGTSYFIDGVAGFSHQAAYFDSEKGLSIGVIYFPVTDELVYAIKGQGAFLQTKGNTQALEQPFFPPSDLLRFGHPQRYKGKKYQYLLQDIGADTSQIVYTTAYKTLQFVRGELEVSIYSKPFMAPWDWAGDKVILEELGFFYAYLNGKELDFLNHPIQNNPGYLICPAIYQQELSDKIMKNHPNYHQKRNFK